MKLGLTLLGAVLVLAVFVAGASARESDTTACVGTIVGGGVGAVVVPYGATCILENVTVKGDVTNQGSLVVGRGYVTGNLYSSLATSLVLKGATVVGSVDAIGLPLLEVAGSTIGATIDCAGSTVPVYAGNTAGAEIAC